MSNCESCMAVAVCSKYRATGGHVRDCKYYVEQKHARWEDGRCTSCGEEAVTEWNEGGGEQLLTRYCPSCGADMRTERTEYNEKRIEPASMGGVQPAEE